MKLSQLPNVNARPFKSVSKIDNIEDLYEDEALKNIFWNERALSKAMPKSNNKVKKMKG